MSFPARMNSWARTIVLDSIGGSVNDAITLERR
jgi:hypothetical protein